MTITIPSRDIKKEDKKLFRERVLMAGVIRAKAKGIAFSEAELVWRDLAPEDVGLTSWATPSMLANTYTTWISHTVSRYSILCFYKILQLSNDPTVASIKFWLGPRATTKGIHELEACYSGLPIIKNLAKALMSPGAKEVIDRLAGRDREVSPDFGSPMEAYFGEPYVYDPEDTFVVEVKSRKASPGDYLVLGGYVIERIGVTIA